MQGKSVAAKIWSPGNSRRTTGSFAKPDQAFQPRSRTRSSNSMMQRATEDLSGFGKRRGRTGSFGKTPGSSSLVEQFAKASQRRSTFLDGTGEYIYTVIVGLDTLLKL